MIRIVLIYSISSYDPEGEFLFLKLSCNSGTTTSPPSQGTYLTESELSLMVFEKLIQPILSVDGTTLVELKELPPHLGVWNFWRGDNKLPVIIAKELDVEEKSALVKVLKSHKRALAWKLSDIQGINPEFCTHKILMEEDYAPAVQHQIRVNPKINDVIKKEVKNFSSWIELPISDSPWTLEFFFDDFSVFGNSFQNCLSRLGPHASSVKDSNFCLKLGEEPVYASKRGIIVITKLHSCLLQTGDLPSEIIDDAKRFRIEPVCLPTLQNYHAGGDSLLKGMIDPAEKQFFQRCYKHYFLEDPFLFKICADQWIRRCVTRQLKLLRFYQLATMDPPGVFLVQTSLPKQGSLTSGFLWPTIFKDAPRVCKRNTVTRATSRKKLQQSDEMPPKLTSSL
ncbi:hypothetical protein Tco_0439097 [Tanacetum coccineum]